MSIRQRADQDYETFPLNGEVSTQKITSAVGGWLRVLPRQ